MPEARALHVAQQRLVERARASSGPFVVWDVGLGAAANAIAVLEAFSGFAAPPAIELHSFDRTSDALDFALRHSDALDYSPAEVAALRALRSNGCVRHGAIEWHLHLGDFPALLANAAPPPPHAILYDPYSPRVNREMWTLEHLQRLFAALDPRVPCLWTNTTRSTRVRVTLLLAGFCVGRGVAIGEKDETTVATNVPELLVAPLDLHWLDRVRRSTASAPLRTVPADAQQIIPHDFAALQQHPQFRNPRLGCTERPR